MPPRSIVQSNQTMLAQSRQEEIMRNHLERLGCVVEFGTALSSVCQEKDHVEAKVVRRGANGEVMETIWCRWLIGTDGARSKLSLQ